MNRQGKNWGYTTRIFKSEVNSVYHLEIKKGGYCSEHYHNHKHNEFYVIMGVLEMTIWQQDDAGSETGLKDVTLLASGQSTSVPPGLYHQFRAITKCEAIEIYQVSLDEPDIERRSEGGLEKKC